MDVFSMNILGMNLDHNIDFAIDVEMRTKLISISPYSMASSELKELKEHL